MKRKCPNCRKEKPVNELMYYETDCFECEDCSCIFNHEGKIIEAAFELFPCKACEERWSKDLGICSYCLLFQYYTSEVWDHARKSQLYAITYDDVAEMSASLSEHNVRCQQERLERERTKKKN